MINLRDHERSLPSKERFVKKSELKIQLSHVVGHPKRVGQRRNPIHYFAAGVSNHALAELMLPIFAKI